MTKWNEAHRRLMKSAKVLKAFFEAKFRIPLQILTEGAVYPAAGDVVFPKGVASYGLVGFRPLAPLSSSMAEEIVRTSSELLESLTAMEQRFEDLSELQCHLERVTGNAPSNVVAFRRRLLQSPVKTGAERAALQLKRDCLIECADEPTLWRMAHEIHLQSRRTAFVEFGDLIPESRQSLSLLLDLGSITVFIPEILQLTALEQETLSHLIKRPLIGRPLLLIGTRLAYPELRSHPALDTEFLALAAQAYLKLTRPFSEYKSQGLIQYFLDSLS